MMAEPPAPDRLETADERAAAKAASGRRPSAGVLWWGLLAAAVAAAFVAGALWRPSTAEPLPVLGKVPDFELLDQRGEPVARSDLSGRVWVAAFIFTRCRNACPGMTAQLLRVDRLLQEAPELRARVRLVAFTLDPEHDTSEVLAEFARRWGADPDLWHFLSGERSRIVELCERGFHLAAGGAAAAEGVLAGGPLHSDRFVLVDGAGAIRGTFRPGAVAGDFEKLVAGIRTLASSLDEGD